MHLDSFTVQNLELFKPASETNKKATSICSQKKEIFLKDNQPMEPCSKHATPLSRFKKD